MCSTVSSLGVLSGKLLLGMTKDEIRTVCPEEGGKVFFQLQAIKSAIAVSNACMIQTHIQLQHISNVSSCCQQLASESSGMYNGRY